MLCDDEGKPLTQKMVQVMMRRLARRADVTPGLHILRHTFCSHPLDAAIRLLNGAAETV